MINLNTQTKLPEQVKWCLLPEVVLLVLLPSIFIHQLFWILTMFIGIPLLIYFLLLYNSISFVVENDKITVNYGIIIKKSKSIPFNTIQSIENVRGIRHQIFGLSVIKIWTSSPEQIRAHNGSTTHKPDVSLDLIKENADWLKNFILSKK